MKEKTYDAIRLWFAKMEIGVAVIICLAVLIWSGALILRRSVIILMEGYSSIWDLPILICGCVVLVACGVVIRYIVLRTQNKIEGWQLGIAEWLAKRRRRRLGRSMMGGDSLDDDL